MASMTFRELNTQIGALYSQRKYEEALRLVEEQAAHFPEHAARTTFWRLCFLSLCQRPQDCLSALEKALDAGFWWEESQFLDPDLDAVRELAEFKHLAAASQGKFEEARRHMKRDQTLLVPEPPASGKYPLLMALHGRPSDKNDHLEQWEVARQKGWLVLSAQSTQPIFTGAYVWDDPLQGLADLLCYYEEILQKYPIDRERVVMAGFSQGSGMSIYAALQGTMGVRGFIGVSSWWGEVTQLDCEGNDRRGYFILGGKDRMLECARQIQETLRKNNVQFAEELHAEMGHEFPADFAASFDKAIEYIFKEHE